MTDLAFAFERVFELAERGRYSTSPNPRVGAVVVDAAGAVVGEGWHERAGSPHAEAVALAEAGSRARGATVVVNLEPCAHHGRTPPCADALVAAGVARVVFSVLDPDPRTAGKGRERLREGGVATETGAFAERAERLNEPFLTAARSGRPFVHLKWGASLDGKIATASGRSRWVTCEEARADGMRLREECDAILVGAGTVRTDDPALTRRAGLNRSVVPHRRVVVDGRLRVPADRKVFSPAAPGEAWLATAVPEADPRLAPFRDAGVRVLSLPSAAPGRVDLAALLVRLAGSDVRSLLLEGGGETAFSFLESGLVDRVTGYYAPLLLGGREAPSALGGAGFPTLEGACRLSHLEVAPLGDGFRVSGRVARPAA
ncbi:MAG TPA: bifunctional diaminohydroxyphosphoribosylaminopyrimidine deaminase/5-amino-6-(5-phosphoribosylamino)uracil reductase RibD [Thermoanaerobaculia bacterium]|jgi:diaminohydroxyphosphoribosylaminopyrimidine deaminase/5-amino-6-(5-phosphoribosylamino)uracil reductase|nr:bifunctional diaminohydroxyphosphoribosylaminopyrimidine deaminase/5-amino-6-(5-phosphoribosylamino)uracil reductase RibD [Thermoanaerobaculia bacterium]HQN10011.1 bifunctional diaminohydroxyphosphoribosylaminopyrimidine deaminase/5-amino-6-(5-phosphoribosylamino)uracil reductase RibD [Thermoanaerobaculia bacterium]HQP86913.1 bifunctional diaminohydroxyphosphoribosylaminopyrimidine deaminase/5-amino-6-(5-phosphoribosylamino)uracil reductase RibD [Thermoanaerobaculia bacterium]